MEEKRPKTTPSVAALQVATSSPKPQASQCAMCNKSHSTDRCFRLVQCSGVERRDKNMKAGLCYRCLKKGHIARGCCVTSTKCNGRHHKLLCGVQYNTNSKISSKQAASADTQSSSETVDTTAVETSPNSTSIPNRIMFVQSTSLVLLQTARVKVRGARGIREATILFDTGSDRSYVTSDFVNKAGPLWVDSQPIAYAAFGSGNSSNMHVRNIYDVTLQDETGTDHTLFATEVPAIFAPLVHPEVSQQVLQSFGELSWASDCDYSELAEIQVDILIGLDSYWKFVKPQIVSSSLMTGLMAQATIFGWVLFGAVSNSQPTSGSEIAHQMLCLTATVSDQSVHAFWNLESVGICDDKGCDDADYVLTQFQQDILKVHGRYEVALPWKPGARQRLLNNEKLARRREFRASSWSWSST